MTQKRMGGSSVDANVLGVRFFDGTYQITAAVDNSDATQIQGVDVSPTPPSHNGELLIYDSVLNAYVPGDPLVQGLFPEGTATSGINPILVAGKGADGLQHSLSVDNSGALNVSATFSGTVSENLTQWAGAALGVPTPYGTAPSSGNYLGVNAYITNTIPVTGTFWQATQPVSGEVAVSNFPSTVAVTGTFWQATQPVSVASLPLPSGASTAANQTTELASLASIDSKTPVLVSGSIPVTGAFWQATQPVSIAGTVVVSLASTTITGSVAVTGTFWQATQPVSGTFWQATQPVSGAISFTAPQHVIVDSATLGTVAVSGTFWQATQPVSGTFWQATQPVSGTVAISGSVAVTGTFWQATQPISGAISFTAPQHVIIDSGTLGTLTISGSVSVSNFPASQVVTLASTTITGSVAVTGTFWQATQPVSSTQLPAALDGSGFLKVHEQGTVPVTGTFWQATQPISGAVSFTAPQHVIVDSATLGTVAVSGTFWQATQPVSLAASVDVSDRAARLLGHVTVDNASIAVTGAFWQAIQPVSGTVTANQGTSPWVVSLASTTITGSVAVTGTFWQATQPVSGTVAFSNTTIAVTNTGTFAVQAAQSGTWNIGTVTSITNALPAGTNIIGKVDILGNAGGTLDTAKGTQAATAIGTQQLHDAGRNARVFMLDAYTAAPLVEAMASVVQWYGNAAVGATVSPVVVPAGKTLRLNSWKIMYQSLATVGYVVVRVRINTAGTAVLTSPLAWSFECGSGAGATTTAVTGSMTTETGDFPEGFEIPAAAGVGFSIAGYGPTGALTLEGGVRFAVYGYEY